MRADLDEIDVRYQSRPVKKGKSQSVDIPGDAPWRSELVKALHRRLLS